MSIPELGMGYVQLAAEFGDAQALVKYRNPPTVSGTSWISRYGLTR